MATERTGIYVTSPNDPKIENLVKRRKRPQPLQPAPTDSLTARLLEYLTDGDEHDKMGESGEFDAHPMESEPN